MSDIRVCAHDGEPLVFTMEFPGAEWYCVVCGAHEGLFGARVSATPALRERLGTLTEQYERERCERVDRLGREYTPAPRVGDPGVEAPVCSGCGAEPASGTPLGSGKPREWYSRTIEGHTEYACSRACIHEGSVLPW